MWWKILLTTLILVLITAPVYSEENKTEYEANSALSCELDLARQTDSLSVCINQPPIGWEVSRTVDGGVYILFIQAVDGPRVSHQIFIKDEGEFNRYAATRSGTFVGDRHVYYDPAPRPGRVYRVNTYRNVSEPVVYSIVRLVNLDQLPIPDPTATPTPTNTSIPTTTPQPTVTPTPPAYPAPAALVFLPLLIR